LPGVFGCDEMKTDHTNHTGIANQFGAAVRLAPGHAENNVEVPVPMEAVKALKPDQVASQNPASDSLGATFGPVKMYFVLGAKINHSIGMGISGSRNLRKLPNLSPISFVELIAGRHIRKRSFAKQFITALVRPKPMKSSLVSMKPTSPHP
jgi:hypothetical protein